MIRELFIEGPLEDRLGLLGQHPVVAQQLEAIGLHLRHQPIEQLRRDRRTGARRHGLIAILASMLMSIHLLERGSSASQLSWGIPLLSIPYWPKAMTAMAAKRVFRGDTA